MFEAYQRLSWLSLGVPDSTQIMNQVLQFNDQYMEQTLIARSAVDSCTRLVFPATDAENDTGDGSRKNGTGENSTGDEDVNMNNNNLGAQKVQQTSSTKNKPRQLLVKKNYFLRPSRTDNPGAVANSSSVSLTQLLHVFASALHATHAFDSSKTLHILQNNASRIQLPDFI